YDASPFSALDDLVALLDQRGIERATVVGCSKGGQVAYEAALCRPERVDRLVLIASAPQGAPPHDIPPALDALFAAVDDADDKGDRAWLNELEAHLWLDGPDAPRGRVGVEGWASVLE